MPAARVSWRYQVVLNGFAVSIPPRQLPKLSRQSFAARVWPSFTYQPRAEPQPGGDRRRRLPQRDGHERRGREDRRRRRRRRQHEPVPQRRRLHGARRASRSARRSSPTGRSSSRARTPAPGRTSRRSSRSTARRRSTARTSQASPPATPDTCAPGRRRPSADLRALGHRAEGLHRQLPRLQRPDAGRPHRRVAGDRGGVRADGQGRHGRHQLLRRRPRSRAAQRRPDRGDEQRRGGGRRAGDRSGQRPRRLRLRLGRLAGHGARRDLGRGGLELAGLRARARRVRRAATRRSCTCRSRREATTPTTWASANQQLVDVGKIDGTNGLPVDRQLCGGGADPNGADNPLPANSLERRDRARLSRHSARSRRRPARAQQAGATGIVLVDNRFGEANRFRFSCRSPAAWSPTSTERRCGTR